MKIFVHDTVFPIGHKLLNNRLLSYLGEENLLISNHNSYYNHYQKNWRFIECNAPITNKYSVIARGLTTFASISTLQKAKREDFDKIIYFTFDTINFAAEYFFLKKHDVYLIHHLNTSELIIPRKAHLFKTYANKVKHIVFGDFIKSFLINTMKVDERRVLSLPHPILINKNLNLPESNRIESMSDGRKLWIALGYATDLNLIDQIIEYENKTKLLENNNIKLVLRWFKQPFETKSISIISGHLETSLYNTLYASACGVLLLYPHNYKHRFSGAIMDALANGKPVIGSSIPVTNEFEMAYPSFCSSFKSVPDLFEKIIEKSSPKTGDFQEFELNQFYARHSDNLISESFNGFLKD